MSNTKKAKVALPPELGDHDPIGQFVTCLEVLGEYVSNAGEDVVGDDGWHTDQEFAAIWQVLEQAYPLLQRYLYLEKVFQTAQHMQEGETGGLQVVRGSGS